MIWKSISGAPSLSLSTRSRRLLILMFKGVVLYVKHHPRRMEHVFDVWRTRWLLREPQIVCETSKSLYGVASYYMINLEERSLIQSSFCVMCSFTACRLQLRQCSYRLINIVPIHEFSRKTLLHISVFTYLESCYAAFWAVLISKRWNSAVVHSLSRVSVSICFRLYLK
jgi:hypothetical protein